MGKLIPSLILLKTMSQAVLLQFSLSGRSTGLPLQEGSLFLWQGNLQEEPHTLHYSKEQFTSY